jgi:hypothetical protein
MACFKQNYDFGKVDCELRLIRAVTSVADSFSDKKSKIKVKINDFATLILEASTLMLEEGGDFNCIQGHSGLAAN